MIGANENILSDLLRILPRHAPSRDPGDVLPVPIHQAFERIDVPAENAVDHLSVALVCGISTHRMDNNGLVHLLSNLCIAHTGRRGGGARGYIRIVGNSV